MNPVRVLVNSSICLKSYLKYSHLTGLASTFKGCVGIGSPLLGKQPQRSFIPSKHKPMKKPPTKPLHFDYSGDLEEVQDVDKSLIKGTLSGSQEIDSANDVVKRLCSLEFADGREVLNHRLEEIESKIRTYPSETRSLELRIATYTIQIRNKIKHCLEFRKDKKSKALLIDRIQKRKKLIKMLRQEDYPKFEWLMTELNINYVPSPEYVYFKKTSKRVLRKQAVKEEMYALKKQKLADFQELMVKEREEFLKEKEQMLDKIEKELKEIQLVESELESAEKEEEESLWRDIKGNLKEVPIPELQAKLKETNQTV